MRLSWNEVRARAARFAEEWRDAAYEKGETQSFYNDFFEDVRCASAYGRALRGACSANSTTSSGFIDLFWPGVLIVEQKSAGPRSDKKAYGQAGEYFDSVARARTPSLHPGQRLPDLRASRS